MPHQKTAFRPALVLLCFSVAGCITVTNLTPNKTGKILPEDKITATWLVLRVVERPPVDSPVLKLQAARQLPLRIVFSERNGYVPDTVEMSLRIRDAPRP